MSWRPEGWEIIRDKILVYPSSKIPGKTKEEVFEAGADAYEEALKKDENSIYIDNAKIETPDNTTLWKTVPMGRKGYLAFIPEQEDGHGKAIK